MRPGEGPPQVPTEVAEIASLSRAIFTADARMREAASRCADEKIGKAAGSDVDAEDPRRLAPEDRPRPPAEVEAATYALALLGYTAALLRRLSGSVGPGAGGVLAAMGSRAEAVLALLCEAVER